MPKKAIHQPHDKLFKVAFGCKENAIGFLQNRLPKELLAQLDLDTLQLERSEFVSRALKGRTADIVYSLRINNNHGYLYIPLEHQTAEDKEMVPRLLEYNASIMRQHVKQHGGKLPAIINLLLYTGKNPYKCPRTIAEAFVDPKAPHRMLNHTFLVALNEEDDDVILHDKKVALAELLLKQGVHGDFCDFLQKHGELISQLLNESDYATEATIYILSREQHEPEEIIEKLSNLDPTIKNDIMTAYDKLIYRGEQRGMHKGRQEERLSISRSMLAAGIAPDIIKKVTGQLPTG